MRPDTSGTDTKHLHGEDYVKRFESGQSPMRLERLIERIDLTPEMRVCDYGCGSGMLMPHLQSKVGHYTGIDFSEEFIAAGNKHKASLGFEEATLICDDIKAFATRHPGEFDAAFAMDFSEHVPDADWLAILESIRSTLKPHCPLYLHTPNADFFLEIMKDRNFILKQFPEHIAVRDTEENASLLRKAGFREIEISRIAHYYPILKPFHLLSGIPLIGRFFAARLFIVASA